MAEKCSAAIGSFESTGEGRERQVAVVLTLRSFGPRRRDPQDDNSVQSAPPSGRTLKRTLQVAGEVWGMPQSKKLA